LRYRDGTTYEGSFLEGDRSGFGTYVVPNSFTYKGEWKNNSYHGNGRTDFSNGDSYEGEFVEGYFHGYGIWKVKDKNIYRGNFAAGARSGSGRIEWASGEWYEGEFENDAPHGVGACVVKEQTGTCTFKNGELVDQKASTTEEGASGA
jgi:hypothetical protein